MNALYLIFIILAGAIILYHFILRPKILRKGATKEEAGRNFPGDELIPPNPFRSTMAVNFNGPPQDVWPWLVQLGWGKAAFYSYNGIESLFGMDLHNADHIHTEWQDLNIGDTMWMSRPRRKSMFPVTRVESIKPHKELVFALYGPEDTDTKPSGSWSFILEPLDENNTRLYARLQVKTSSIMGKMIYYFFLEPAHFIMQHGMFKGLKKRLAPIKTRHLHV